MPAMTCPRCDGDMEYEMERVDSGDGPWAQSGWVGHVSFTAIGDSPETAEYRTSCGCFWDNDGMANLNDAATERAAEWTDEP